MSPDKDPSSGTRRPVPAYIEATAETQAIPVVAHKMELAAARDALLQEKMSPVEAAQLPTSSRLDDLEAARERRKENRYKRLQRLSSLEPKRGPVVEGLGPWSFILPFAGYIAWWALGPGDLAWPIGAIIMVIAWQGVRGLRIPAPWILWIAFLAWVPLTFMMIDTSGRVVGAIYRYILLIAPFIFAIHVYNARRRLPLRAILATMTVFLLSITIGGYIAMAFPELVIRTPMAYVLPDGLLGNELVREMAIRRTTQWEATNIIATEPRPSAPFLYANTWGNVYSLVLPLALVHCLFEFRLKSRWRWPAVAVCVASVVPAVNTLNRGMFIGLGVVAVWVAIQFLLAGRWRGVSVGAALLAIVGFIWAISPSGAEFFHRAATAQSTVDRMLLYYATIEELWKSPILGFGAPRPSPTPWLPSLGTQGQFWNVLFSHGLVGVLLFVGFFGLIFFLALGRRDILGSTLAGLVLATLAESFVYGMMTGMMLSLLAVALLARGDSVEKEVERINTEDLLRKSQTQPSTRRQLVRG
ncbi:MAG: ligase [Actinomycetaceae bacterium]|nr:ligase [Actinomycetaceae bacterium]